MFCPGPGLSLPSDRSDPRQPQIGNKRHGLWKVVFSPLKVGCDSHLDDSGTRQVDTGAQCGASLGLSGAGACLLVLLQPACPRDDDRPLGKMDASSLLGSSLHFQALQLPNPSCDLGLGLRGVWASLCHFGV